MDLPTSYKGNGSSIVHFASGSQHLLSVADGMQYRNAWTPPPRIYPES
jgi:hypothetical protein